MDGGFRHPMLELNQRTLAGAIAPTRRAQLLIARAEMLARLGAADEARKVLRSAAAAVASARNEAASSETTAVMLAIDLQRAEATLDYFVGRVPESVATLRAAIANAIDARLPLARAQCLATLAVHLVGDGRDFDAIDPALEALQLAGNRDALTNYRALLALSKLALAHGLQDLAAPLFAEMLVAARALDDPLAEAAAFERMTIAHCESARVAYLRGSLQPTTLDASIAAARENIAQSERAGGIGMRAVNQCRLAQLLALRGESGPALALLQQSIPQLQPVATMLLPARADLAATLSEHGRVDEARIWAREALAALDGALPALCRAYVWRRCAEVLARGGSNESVHCIAESRAALRQFEENRRRMRERLQQPLSDLASSLGLGLPGQFGAVGRWHVAGKHASEN